MFEFGLIERPLELVLRYNRLDLGVPVEIGYLIADKKRIFQIHNFRLSVVPGGLYSVQLWVIGEGYIGSVPKEALPEYRAKSDG